MFWFVEGEIFWEKKCQTGQIKFKDGTTFAFNFEVIQRNNGRIMARGNFSNICQNEAFQLFQKLFSQMEVVEIIGTTEEGEEILLVNLLRLKGKSSLKNGKIKSEDFYFSVGRIEIKRDDFNQGDYYNYYINNLTIKEKIELETSDFEIEIQPFENISEIEERLKIFKGIEPTHTIKTKPKNNSVKNTEKIVYKLCILLTLAAGIGIGWYGYEVIKKGEKTFSCFRQPKIGEYCSLNLIPLKMPTTIKEFLEKGLRVYEKANEEWNIHNAILQYTDGKKEEDFLNPRALKLAITMEILKNKFQKIEEKEYIMDEKEFSQKEIKEYLEVLFSEEPFTVELSKQDMIIGHVKGLNRYSFRNTIKLMDKKIGLKRENKEIGKYVEIRNSLVHRGEFVKKEYFGNNFSQYLFLMVFIGKTMLVSLGYDGDYLDWTKLSQKGNFEENIICSLKEEIY